MKKNVLKEFEKLTKKRNKVIESMDKYWVPLFLRLNDLSEMKIDQQLKEQKDHSINHGNKHSDMTQSRTILKCIKPIKIY